MWSALVSTHLVWMEESVWRCLGFSGYGGASASAYYSHGVGGGEVYGDVWDFQGMVVLVLVLSTHLVWVGFVYVQMF